MKLTDKIKYGVYLALLYPLALLPFWALYRLSDLMYLIIGRLMKYRRKVVVENLKHSFPELDDKQIEQLQHKFYRHFCDIIVETIKLLHVSDKTLRRRIRLYDYDVINKAAAEGRPVVLFVGHYGNWELVPTSTLYYTPDIISAHIYKPLHDEAADKLMRKVRGRFNSMGIPQNNAVRTLLGLRAEDKPFIVGFISDQRSNSKVIHQRMEFLNHDTPFNVGGESIGNKIGALFLYLDVSQDRRGYYDMRVKPIDIEGETGEYPYTRRYMQMLEHTIRRRPELWLWSHRRWLYH